MEAKRPSRLARFFLRLIGWYQRRVSPVLSARTTVMCVYEPSCSEYMRLAVLQQGAVRGVINGLRRLSRCRHGYGGTDYPKGAEDGVSRRKPRSLVLDKGDRVAPGAAEQQRGSGLGLPLGVHGSAPHLP